MAKNIEINYKQGESEYEVLYPNVKVESVIDIEEHYYTKNEINGQISDIIPNPYGVLAIKATDDEGNPVSVQLTVNPKINNSSTITTDSGSGLFVVFVNPATYNLTAPAGSDFIEYNIDVPSAQVKTNQVTNVNVGVNVVQSGELEITSSKTIQFPANFNIPVDIWGCGGGASGVTGTKIVTDENVDFNRVLAAGGGGGYTKLLKNISLSGKSLQIKIGNGGKNGSNGGNTNIILNGTTYSANGGKTGGYYGRSSYLAVGGNGGSGGGTCGVDENYEMIATNGGQNGANGKEAMDMGSGMHYGKGQGSTTRKFGESGGALYCSGSGAVGGQYSGDRNPTFSEHHIGNPGDGAGQSVFAGVVNYDNDTSVKHGKDATTYGSAGGGIIGVTINATSIHVEQYVAGAGKQGVVFIRWPSQST